MSVNHPLGTRLGTTRAEVSRLGFGAAALGNLFTEVTDTNAHEALEQAWLQGIRYFDTAPYYGYGLSERRVGNALRAKPRDAFCLSTKVGRLLRADAARPDADEFHDPLPFAPVFDYSYDATWRSVEDSLQRLGLARIDIALLHDLDPTVHDAASFERHLEQATNGACRALDEMRSTGIVAAIGLGINHCETAEHFVRNFDIDVVLLAGRYTLLEHAASASLLPECEGRGVAVVIGGPFNSGVLASDVHDRYDYAPTPPAVREKVDRLRAVCARHQIDLAAAALQFPFGQPAVVSVIPGMRTAGQVRENAERMGVEIPSALWDDLLSEGMLPADIAVPA